MRHVVGQVVWVFGTWLGEPSLLLALSAMVAAVLGAGRAAGLPLLFWNERRWPQFEAGLAATFVVAETLFVIHLIRARAGGHCLPLLFDLPLGGAIWLGLVVGRAVLFHRASRPPPPADQAPAAAARPRMSATSTRGVTPAFLEVAPPALTSRPSARHAAGRAARTGPPVPMDPASAARVVYWPFVAGAALATLAVAASMGLGKLVGPEIDRSVGRVLEQSLPSLARRIPAGDLHLHVAAAAVFVTLLTVFFLVRHQAGPAVGLCMLIALFSGAYGFLTFLTGSRGVLLVLGIAILKLAGTGRYRLRLPALAARYPDRGSPAAYPPAARAEGPSPGVTPLLLDQLISAEAQPGDWPSGPSKAAGKRPLILVATSGGGIRAAAWTAGILGRLDETVDGFRAATRMVTGASGGMVGAAAWIARCQAPTGAGPAEDAVWQTLLDAIAADSLTPMARRLFFHDVPLAFWPGPNLRDRGRALEEAWIENLRSKLGITFDLPLAALRAGEEDGRWPSLVFTPMLIEDGRRLVLSNLDLRRVLISQSQWLGAPGAAPTLQTSSVMAYHGATLFPAEWPHFPLSTAARLSASFPYVSPAVVLPTVPRRRIVDAGYYDNYGLDLTSGWLREALETHAGWLERHVSGVLVIQIRDNVSDLSINPQSSSERGNPEVARGRHGGGSGFEGLSSPPQGLLSARDSVSLFRNDAQLETVTQLYEKAFKQKSFVTTTVFEFKGEASLSWYLTQQEIAGMKAQIASDPITEKLRAIDAWVAAPATGSV